MQGCLIVYVLPNIPKPQENMNIKSIYEITLKIKQKNIKTFYSNSPIQLSKIYES